MANQSLGIVIPTHNRSAALLTCLAHLEKQTFTDFEVILVDDGSTDDTAERIKSYQSRTPLCMRYVRQANGGPAKARNAGISMLQAPICLMLGDDIFATPTLVEKHVQAHREDADLRLAALGFTRWSTSGQAITPFMRWLDEAHVQFAYPLLLAGTKPDWPHFYTSNVSVKTELLRRFAFNEVFPYAAMEDVELAYRIKQCFGLEMRFLPDAVADHLHPTTFSQGCARMVRAGYSAGIFYDLWPEQRPPSGRGLRQDIMEVMARSPRLLQLLSHLAELFPERARPRSLTHYLVFSHFELGLQSQIKSAKRHHQPEAIARSA